MVHFRVESRRQIVENRVVNCGLEMEGVIRDGHCVKVDNEENAVVIGIILKFSPIFNRAQIIADMYRTRRLYSRKHNFFTIIACHYLI